MAKNTISAVGIMSQEELRNKYDSLANEYERKVWFDQSILGVARLRKQLMFKARGKVLDVACGTGLNFALFPPESEITGVDLSPGMLDMARQNASQLGFNVNLAVMDAQNLEFADASFDTVISSLSTCTFPNPVQSLQEMRRVCRPEGSILLLEHGHSSLPWIAEFQDRHVYRHYQENAGCRWNQDPLDLVHAAGLRILTSKRAMFGIFYLIEAMP